MALPVCALCGENEAAQMITNFETGESLAICADDFPTFVLGLAEKFMEAGMIELPEVEEPAPAGDDAGVADPLHAGTEPDPDLQDASESPTASPAAKVPAKRPRATRAKSAAPGPSPAESAEAPTATVDTQTAETAESSAIAGTN